MGSLKEKLWLDVSLLSADLARLEAEIARLAPLADSFHFDVCDGHYAPRLFFFPELVARLRPLTALPFHIHLLATRPQDLLDAFLQAGADRVTVPIECGKRVWPALDLLRARGKAAGVSLEPDTPAELVKPFRSKVDAVLLVTGAELDEPACDRVTEVKTLLDGTDVRLLVKGGVTAETAPLLRASGADGLVFRAAELASAAPLLELL